MHYSKTIPWWQHPCQTWLKWLTRLSFRTENTKYDLVIKSSQSQLPIVDVIRDSYTDMMISRVIQPTSCEDCVVKQFHELLVYLLNVGVW